jgi:hypothetical protein
MDSSASPGQLNGQRFSDLLEVRRVHDEDGRSVLIWFGGAARFSQRVDDRFYVLRFHPDEERDVAPSQEAPRAGDSRHPVMTINEGVCHEIGVFITDNGDDQFHLAPPNLDEPEPIKDVDGKFLLAVRILLVRPDT